MTPKNPTPQPPAVKPKSLPAEILDFARHNKKWWLTPIVVLLVLAGLLLVLGGSGVAPFIYSLF